MFTAMVGKQLLGFCLRYAGGLMVVSVVEIVNPGAMGSRNGPFFFPPSLLTVGPYRYTSFISASVTYIFVTLVTFLGFSFYLVVVIAALLQQSRQPRRLIEC